MLLHKYRIDRVRLASRDAVLYEATDTTLARHVCIKVLRRDRLTIDEAHGANVVDVGRTMGMPYVVTTEWIRSVPPPPARRASSIPPPLPPRRTSSNPPPLPPSRASSKPPPSKPPPLPPRSRPSSKPPPLPQRVSPPPEELAIPVVLAPVQRAPIPSVDVELPRDLKRSSPWPVITIVLAAALTGIAGWSIGQRESHPAAGGIANEPAIMTESPSPTNEQQPIIAKPPPTHTEEAVEAPPPANKPRNKAAGDPLTL